MSALGGAPAIGVLQLPYESIETRLWIKIHDQIKVIAHDGKGIDGDCEVLSQTQHALL